jgi:hypothetical protein
VERLHDTNLRGLVVHDMNLRGLVVHDTNLPGLVVEQLHDTNLGSAKTISVVRIRRHSKMAP